MLGGLFVKYMAGQIDEPLWKKFISALDAKESKPLERMALIAFMHDVLASPSGHDEQGAQLSRLLAETVQA